MVIPVRGLMMGMALRARVAAGWWSLRLLECWLWNVGGMKGGEDELSENPDATCWTCWVGECSGEFEVLANDDRSDDALWMETSWRRRERVSKGKKATYGRKG